MLANHPGCHCHVLARGLQREGSYFPLSLVTSLSGTETLSQALHTFVHEWDFNQAAVRQDLADSLAERILALRRPVLQNRIPLLSK